jgi:hypothetical protein
MIEQCILFAISWGALSLTGIYDRGKTRILRRPNEREILRVYRAFRRGLQRDWKP